jgi:hypothetical protein
MVGGDGHALHQCLLTTRWTRPKRWHRLAVPAVEKTGRRWVAARWAKGGHQKARADRSPVRADPFRSHIWAGNGSTGPRLFVWVGPLGWLFPHFSVRADVFGRAMSICVGLLEMPKHFHSCAV